MTTIKKTTKKSAKKEKMTKAEGDKKVKKITTKTTPKIKPEKEEVTEKVSKSPRYCEAIGRRKTAVARVRLFTQGEKTILVNEKSYKDYFPTLELQQVVTASLEKMKSMDRFRVLVKVRGGGVHAQAEATRHGISRTLVEFNPDFRKRLRRAGYLTRDPRMRERKKFGLKRARRAPQWSKR